MRKKKSEKERGNEERREAARVGVFEGGARKGTSSIRRREKKGKGGREGFEGKKKTVKFGEDGEMKFSDCPSDAKVWNGECGVRQQSEKKNEGNMERAQWKKEVARDSWDGKGDKGKFQEQERTKSRNEMRTPSRKVRCTLLSGSAWSTERKYTRRYTSTFKHIFGTEHKMRNEEKEEQSNKEVRQ